MSDTITKSIIVKTDVSRAYQAWENFENFPMFMKYVKSVTKTGAGMSHWEVQGPLGKTLEWDAELTRRDENKRLGWSTKDRDGDVVTSGQVTFNSLPDHLTEVTVMLHYVPKAGGVAGDVVNKLFANPEKQLEEDLQNYKHFVEGNLDRTAASG